MQEESHTKVLFRYYSDVLEEETVETMWALIVDKENGLYQLDSIPFYGPDIAPDDIFYAEHDSDEKMLTFREVRQRSGSSVVQVVLMKEPYKTSELREQLAVLGCITEGLSNRYFVVEIPAAVNYNPIYSLLKALMDEGRIEFAEPFISSQHAG
ncbi:DUF4265 domain-containing protein [Flavisolibacter tropicus]|uniref:DUF4265 domain-containing protein n=1 Tax=Flavisolibacter tropicus TaxID=1492898 RepID=A0A172TZ23_9BACT|nr:DUF4265 domain-containing protein [Flavisolibacter tropicus]ANE52124.1 hypothetical protein SY85_18115 [Flavisolibacter tropicus]